ncbi:hypothetical protein OHC33_009479 [Knufia fluminis]|uniref:Potassium transport protein n=1 Tax=Knufia fluminis TaxID=191047 RepID=A0AAN8I1N9_9EURO|nr:hypothetical protein OHC33_009479 [Knufia fluminis]
MWKPTLDFITLHYLYIVFLGILCLIILYPNGNLSSTDAYFFGVSGSTESGLNPVDVNDLALYQQLAVYFIPILGNMQVVSIFIVMIRLVWFRKHLKAKANAIPPHRARAEPVVASMDASDHDHSGRQPPQRTQSWAGQDFKSGQQGDVSILPDPDDTIKQQNTSGAASADMSKQRHRAWNLNEGQEPSSGNRQSTPTPVPGIRKSHTVALPSNTDRSPDDNVETPTHITFAPPPRRSTAPADNNHNHAHAQASTLSPLSSDDEDTLDEKRGRTQHHLPRLSLTRSNEAHEATLRRRQRRGPSPDSISFHRVVSNVFVLGDSDPISGHGNLNNLTRRTSRTRSIDSTHSQSRSRSRPRQKSTTEKLKLSAQAMLGRNSHFSNLSEEDRDRLGGIEYRALKLLLKVILSYYISLHLLGIICLTPWIHLTTNPKYREYLVSCGINTTWWSIYSAGTMANNLGFSLTPDSMISFRDAVFPILVMTILAYAGHTFYPVCLRVLIWSISKIYRKDHKIQEPLHFLLEHPRRCYTLLFPSRATWILAGILVALNIVDVILIICLDLDNPEITGIAMAPRFISSIFQAASSRHTGTATFNLANVNPGVQFSLLVMMYVSIFPIAISVRSSNTYEESSLGVYQDDEDPDAMTDTTNSRTYLRAHIRNQLSFDLWYIFLGCFCICCSEAERIMDANDPAFAVFPVFFEVASAYGNVGLSLGHPSVSTSFSGTFNTFSKLVMCAMMIRGRHRGLPVRLDRAIMLPSDRFTADEEEQIEGRRQATKTLPRLKQFHTQ